MSTAYHCSVSPSVNHCPSLDPTFLREEAVEGRGQSVTWPAQLREQPLETPVQWQLSLAPSPLDMGWPVLQGTAFRKQPRGRDKAALKSPKSKGC